MSIENSVAVSGNTLYFANSGGLVQGWDIHGLLDGTGLPTRIFRYWTGEDTDASIVVDELGMLYGGSEWEKHGARGAEVGQMWKIDPANAVAPLVWAQHDEGASKSGVWGTPGIVGDLVVYTTYSGRVVGVDRATGAIRWEKRLPAPVMGSPSIVDNTLLIGRLRRRPPRLRRHEHPRGPARALAGAPRELHRGHPGRLEGPDLHRDPGRIRPRPRRRLRRRTSHKSAGQRASRGLSHPHATLGSWKFCVGIGGGDRGRRSGRWRSSFGGASATRRPRASGSSRPLEVLQAQNQATLGAERRLTDEMLDGKKSLIDHELVEMRATLERVAPVHGRSSRTGATRRSARW